MKHSLKAYLANDLFEGFFSSIQEENILDLLVKLKKKITELLNEEAFDEKKVDHYLKTNDVFIADTEYGVDVKIHIFLDNDGQEKTETDLTNLLSGQIEFTKGQKRYNEIPVKDNNFHEQ